MKSPREGRGSWTIGRGFCAGGFVAVGLLVVAAVQLTGTLERLDQFYVPMVVELARLRERQSSFDLAVATARTDPASREATLVWLESADTVRVADVDRLERVVEHVSATMSSSDDERILLAQLRGRFADLRGRYARDREALAALARPGSTETENAVALDALLTNGTAVSNLLREASELVQSRAIPTAHERPW